LVGINIQPAFFGLSIDDARLYPLFATASDLGLVVAIHTGINYTTHQPMDLERPELLDRIACSFPELRLIACHAGWPWVDVLCGVMRRHSNVYADFGGMAPRYVGEEGTGWQTLRRLMDGPLRNQVLFATDWPVFAMDRAVREWDAMGLKPDTLRHLMSENARSLISRGNSVADGQ
jgi:predicted TIM-barrel fold metal-dependent hydrolase